MSPLYSKNKGKILKVAFVARNNFGNIGTAGTYAVIEKLSSVAKLLVFIPEINNQNEKTVFTGNEGIQFVRTGKGSIKKRLQIIHRKLFSFRPDVIHLINHHQCLLYPLALRRLFPHVSWVLDVKSHLVVDDEKMIKKIRLWSFFLPYYVDAIISPAKENPGTWIPLLKKRVKEIPLGVELSNFKKASPWEGRKKCIRFLYVGSLHPLRKIDKLMRMFQSLADKANREIYLDIFGYGPAEPALKKIAREGRKGIINLNGLLMQKELNRKMSDYDAGIAYVPNELYDHAPSLKSIEFAAAGLPVFASNTAGHRKYIDEGLTFNTFENSSESFCSTILPSIREGVDYNEIEQNDQNIKRFDFQYIVDNDLMELYRNTLISNVHNRYNL